MLNDKISLGFFILLVTAAGFFTWWGVGYTGNGSLLIFLLATAFGMFMAFNIGGNDVANSFGTSVGAGTLTIKQALIVAAIFEVSGAMIAGGAVTDTIRKGIVDLGTLTGEPEFEIMDFVYIMMSALLAAALWLLIATNRGWPVSTTHSIIGGIVGSSITLGWVGAGMDQALSLVHWSQIGTIAISWVLSPVLGGLGSYVIYFYIKKHILSYNDAAQEQLQVIKQRKKALRKEHKTITERMTEIQQIAYTGALARDAASANAMEEASEDDFESDYYKQLYQLEKEKQEVDAHKALVVYTPLLAAGGSMIITMMLLYKGLKNLKLESSDLQNGLIVLMVAAAVWMAIYILARTQRGGSLEKSTFLLFSWMQVFTAAGFAFSHGSNDIANAIGPFAAILDVLHSGEINPKAPVPTAAMLTFGIALVAGLWFIGKEVIRTVGTELTRMHPASGFTAELSAASVVLIASTMGLPVSSTHILVGAVLGIGLVNRSTNWNLMKPIAAAWVITLPAAALLSCTCFLILRAVF
ncbi:inorganic phosphate transporter [Parahaliea mediterranea]|uniref:Phosphate transporter n=1 Tax=Parahaliea mediterranea TaxID=651086 RepID=A0A939DD98_9GAMM|nr:inorganic phosphate transporter [Parahaliea mediterranea]MBN7795457.1 inorganic phosphate transporter [Parahaliea mediterranea]